MRSVSRHTTTAAAMAFTVAILLLAWSSPAVAGPNAPDEDDLRGDEVGIATADSPQASYTFQVETRGTVHASPSGFADEVAAVLGDARGWTLGGSVRFVEVASGGDFSVVLASPAAVDAAHEVCSPDYSCRVGDDVLINDRNWRQATPHWREHGASLTEYRRYLVNHEVGHWLGFGHRGCPEIGQPAPVMVQQSIDTEGCEPNGWPTDAERSDLGSSLGASVHDDWVFFDVLVGDTHRRQIHELAAADIARGHAGFYMPDRAVTRAEMASFLTRALGLAGSDDIPFDDVHPDDTHARQIAALAHTDIARGHDGSYMPDRAVTRAEMASFLTRSFELTG